jgi:hypothetical protein
MSHAERVGPELAADQAIVGEAAQPPRTSRLIAFATAALQSLRAGPRSHEHWRRHRHDHGCECGQCARWRHVERHVSRGRRGGGEI